MGCKQADPFRRIEPTSRHSAAGPELADQSDNAPEIEQGGRGEQAISLQAGNTSTWSFGSSLSSPIMALILATRRHYLLEGLSFLSR